MGDLKASDIEMYDLLVEEATRQEKGLEMIASENFTSLAVREALGSVATNKYSEGYPGRRYYGGNQVIDKIERLTQARALQVFGLDPEVWAVNVQPYSGSTANLGAYNGLLEPGDRMMGLDLPSGGHLSHGYYTAKRKVSAVSRYYTTLPYGLRPDGLIDYDSLEKMAMAFKPKLIVCGASAYPRDIDYSVFRRICDRVGALLMADMAHVAGLVAGGHLNSPFPYCDVVTTTTHKTLRGPRAGMIFCLKKYEKAINESVFPGLQGGPHENQIAAVGVALKEALDPSFVAYGAQVIRNAQALAASLMDQGFELATGGTDNHLVLVNLRPHGVLGSKVEALAEAIGISVNKNAVLGDTSALSPGGVRIGASALTTQGYDEDAMGVIGEIFGSLVTLGKMIQRTSGPKLVDFKKAMQSEFAKDLEKLQLEVQEWISEVKHAT